MIQLPHFLGLFQHCIVIHSSCNYACVYLTCRIYVTLMVSHSCWSATQIVTCLACTVLTRFPAKLAEAQGY